VPVRQQAVWRQLWLLERPNLSGGAVRGHGVRERCRLHRRVGLPERAMQLRRNALRRCLPVL
jgi:hypothetical protein